MEAAELAIDALTGLAVGDALGAAYEGRPFDRSTRPSLTPPAGSRARWTDDTQMALSVVEVLRETGRIDQDRLTRAFAERYEPWRGYGAGMHVLLSRMNVGDDWRTARFAVFPEGSFGNGSAMRVAPLGAFLADRTAEDVVAEARRSAEVTHAHPEGVNGAVATALAAWHAARSRGAAPPPPAPLIESVRSSLPNDSEVARGLEIARDLGGEADLETAVHLLGNGSRVSCADTVPLAVWISSIRLDDYRTAVEMAVAAGGDTDTMAAIVGGIVASRVSAAGIPPEWREAVEPLPNLES
jgi:ADP-ribosylglycohydrolase